MNRHGLTWVSLAWHAGIPCRYRVRTQQRRPTPHRRCINAHRPTFLAPPRAGHQTVHHQFRLGRLHPGPAGPGHCLGCQQVPAVQDEQRHAAGHTDAVQLHRVQRQGAAPAHPVPGRQPGAQPAGHAQPGHRRQRAGAEPGRPASQRQRCAAAGFHAQHRRRGHRVRGPGAGRLRAHCHHAQKRERRPERGRAGQPPGPRPPRLRRHPGRPKLHGPGPSVRPPVHDALPPAQGRGGRHRGHCLRGPGLLATAGALQGLHPRAQGRPDRLLLRAQRRRRPPARPAGGASRHGGQEHQRVQGRRRPFLHPRHAGPQAGQHRLSLDQPGRGAAPRQAGRLQPLRPLELGHRHQRLRGRIRLRDPQPDPAVRPHGPGRRAAAVGRVVLAHPPHDRAPAQAGQPHGLRHCRWRPHLARAQRPP